MRRVVVVAGLGVLAAIAVWLLFAYVFPWVDRTFVSDPVLGAALGR